MDNQLKKQIQEKLNNELASSGGIFQSQAELAKEVGVSAAYISIILSGKWTEKHPSPATWEKVAKRYNIAEHYDTADFLGGWEVLEQVQAQKSIVAFTGEYGYGKSYLFGQYKLKNRQVYIITCRDSMTRKELLEEVCEAVGVEPVSSQAKMENLIMKALNDKDALLIFDECEGVKSQIFASIKNLRRLLEQSCGFVIAGKDLYQDFQKKARKNKAVGALFSRVRVNPFEFSGLTKADLKNIINRNGMKSEDKAIAFLLTNFSDMRSFKNVLQSVRELGQKSITMDILSQVVL